jgi:hypothetical protein
MAYVRVFAVKFGERGMGVAVWDRLGGALRGGTSIPCLWGEIGGCFWIYFYEARFRGAKFFGEQVCGDFFRFILGEVNLGDLDWGGIWY